MTMKQSILYFPLQYRWLPKRRDHLPMEAQLSGGGGH